MSATDKQGDFLMSLIYFQAFLIALTFYIGVWQALLIQEVSLTSPIVILHGFLAASYAVVTGTVGVLSRLRGIRSSYYINIGLFAATILGGSSGWIYLGNQTTQLLDTINVVMTSTVGLGIPLTALTLATVSRSLGRIKEPPFGRRLVLIYTALTSTSLHLLLGVTTVFIGLYGRIFYGHIALGISTGVAMSLAFIVSTRKGYREETGVTLGNSFLLILALVSAVVAGASGALFLLGGPFIYIFFMAESSVLLYAFAFISIEKR